MIERAELHCHTKMSEMSGLAEVRELIHKAKKMGISAIAITDHDTVQAFPYAIKAWKDALSEEDDGIKVILGIEASMVNDLDAIVMNDKGNSLDSDFVLNLDTGAVNNYMMTREMISHKVIIIPTSLVGMRDLYDIISRVNLESFESYLKIPKSLLVEKREGLIIGCCAQLGEVSHAVFDNQSDAVIKKIIDFYDFVEVEPINNYIWPLSQSIIIEDLTEGHVKECISRTVRLGKEESVPVVASSNVYYVNKEDSVAFKILRHTLGFRDSKGWKAKHHLMSTKELLDEFSFLGEEVATEIVVNNPNYVATELGIVQPISPEKKYPVYPDANKKLKAICYKKAHEIYGDKFSDEVKNRLEYEISGIEKNEGHATLFMIGYELVKKSNEAGYLVCSRGCSGASLVSYLAGITETNPLPAHYLCKKCKYTDFDVLDITGYRYGDLGIDLPNKKCPVCGEMLSKEGYDLPVETFLGFQLNNEPYFSMNFAGEYRREAQCGIVNIEGIGQICRVGTISTLSKRQSMTYATKYFKEKKSRRKKENISNIAEKLAGVRKGNGVSPGGIIVVPKDVDLFKYTPVVNYDADSIPQTMMGYFSIDPWLLKLEIIANDDLSFLKYLFDETGIDPSEIQFGEDKKVMSLFSSTEALGIQPDDIKGITVGTAGVPEFGLQNGTAKLLEIIRPKRFTDIIRVESMMHGTQVWEDNAETIVREDPERFAECIAYRDDIMLYLISKGMEKEVAYQIMEYVRKGRAHSGLREKWEWDMRKAGVPDWYIRSCEKIMYLFSKAHCAGYALMSWRLLYYKLYYPEAFYKGWIKFNRAESLVKKGYEYAGVQYEKLEKKWDQRLSWQQIERMERMDACLVVMEMHARGINLA